ncbi:TPA: hypothetical protein ACYLN4_005666 [Burkholderia lata]
MFKSVFAKEFTAVPWLETSALMQSHPAGVVFSVEKPNVIVGPNGAGKSALMRALSLATLSSLTGISALDDKYAGGLGEEPCWRKIEERWREKYEFLGGLTMETDNAPAMFYRPGHLPGNERMVAAAMMTGYFEEAKEYGRLTRNKSSGQQCSALLNRIIEVLKGAPASKQYAMQNWSWNGRKPENWADDNVRHLKARFGDLPDTVLPVILMDEPEQSLDAKNEAMLWRHIAGSNTSNVQVIVATHSLSPIMHPEKYNLIEAVPGYADEVRALL